MGKSLGRTAAGILMVLMAGPAVLAQTVADRIQETDAQIMLVQKQKQLQDNLGVDAILKAMPQVVSVMMFGAETKAKLMLASGVTLTYGEGEVINPRMRVVAITPREVVVAITPSGGAVKRQKGKKAADAVLMPLEFMAGARQNGFQPGLSGGMPGVPGTPVQAGPIPPGLMMAPPPVMGGFPAAMAPSGLGTSSPANAVPPGVR